jgi:outer membrane lipoprotein carrier protein
VERSPVKQTDDARAPLAFLLGQLDFQKYFGEFRSKPEGDAAGSTRITAVPKSKKAPYTQVEFVVTSSYDIRTLKVQIQDGSVMEFGFTGVTPDPKLDPKMFQFQAPAGAEIVNIEEGEGAGQ